MSKGKLRDPRKAAVLFVNMFTLRLWSSKGYRF